MEMYLKNFKLDKTDVIGGVSMEVKRWSSAVKLLSWYWQAHMPVETMPHTDNHIQIFGFLRTAFKTSHNGVHI